MPDSGGGARLQVALDFLNLNRAMRVAEMAVEAGAHIIEAGTPLIKSEGLESVRALRKRFPKIHIVADMKIMDAGKIEVEAAAKAGATSTVVMSAASDATIRECIDAGRNYGIEINVDIMGEPDTAKRGGELERMGASHLGLHTPIDQQMEGLDPLADLRELRSAVKIPIAVAGGINSETAPTVVAAGADVVIVGGAVTKAEDPAAATRDILEAMRTLKPVRTEYFVRVDESGIRKTLEQVSTANISDAMHRTGNIPGFAAVCMARPIVGPAVTVRTVPGDFAKPVEAIDVAEEGDVIVIDAGGVAPAVWGELASHSAQGKGLAGTIVYGACRDVRDIREMGYPVMARLVSPAAAEPKGFGEINVPIRIAGVAIMPGDWIRADEDGVVVIPKARAVESANRAMNVLEQENRIREEIAAGGTLASVLELLRWEKTR